MPDWVSGTPWWVFLVLTVTVIGFIVSFSRWTGRVDNRLDTLTGSINALTSTVAAIQSGLSEVRADIKRILERPTLRSAVKANSPIQLTDFGEKLSATAAAKQ